MAAAAAIPVFDGLRAAPREEAAPRLGPAAKAPSPFTFGVVAQKKVAKKAKIILTEPVPNVGAKGDIVSVRVGYFRNYLAPQGLADLATSSVLRELQRKDDAAKAAIKKIKDDALSLATALKVIGLYQIRKKAGADKQIFGTVTSQDVADVIKMQSGQSIDKREITVPEIKETGKYSVDVKLHPEVTATIEVQVIGTK